MMVFSSKAFTEHQTAPPSSLLPCFDLLKLMWDVGYDLSQWPSFLGSLLSFTARKLWSWVCVPLRALLYTFILRCFFPCVGSYLAIVYYIHVQQVLPNVHKTDF